MIQHRTTQTNHTDKHGVSCSGQCEETLESKGSTYNSQWPVIPVRRGRSTQLGRPATAGESERKSSQVTFLTKLLFVVFELGLFSLAPPRKLPSPQILADKRLCCECSPRHTPGTS